MKRLVYYSDCYIFGGCEKLLLNLIASQTIRDRFAVHYAYARNSDYQEGVERFVPPATSLFPLRILSNHNLFYKLDKSSLNKIAAFCLKLPFVLLELSGLYALCNFLTLLVFFRKIKPELLHINNGGYPAARSCLVAVASARAAGVPSIVFTVNNLAEPQGWPFYRLIDRYVNACVDRFVTASSLAGRRLMDNRRFSPTKVTQIFNGIAIANPQKSRSKLLAGLGIPEHKFIIVTVALLTERKGQLSLLNALESLRQSRPSLFDETVLLLVGDGEDRPVIERFREEHGMRGSVVLTGERDDFNDFIHAADLFVLPSLYNEDMPLVILSAMGCGKAIVATRVAGIVEQIRDGVDGVLVEPGDVAALAVAIEKFHDDRPMAAACGKRAQERYAECFTRDRFVENYLALYEELADERHRKT